MHKRLFMGLMMALLVAVMPVAAQDQEPVACTPEDLAVTTEALGTLGTSYQEVAEYIGDGSDPTALTYGVIAYETLSTGFWNEIHPDLPTCTESAALTDNFGLAVDESIISTGIARLALYEAEFGDTDIAQSYAEYAQARAEWYAEIVNATFGQIGEDGTLPDTMIEEELPACTDDDKQHEAVLALGETVVAYQELGSAAADATPEELTALIGGYAALSSTVWTEIVPALPACAEAVKAGNIFGRLYDETLITVLLSRLSLYEAENGDADAATSLSEGAANRLVLLQEMIAKNSPQPEAE
jgi:hypothetical protein